MKKIFIGIMIILLNLSLVACSSTDDESKPKDTNFIKSMEKATQSRWDYVDKVDEGKIKIESDLEYYKECIKKESDELYKYSNAEFTDVKLKKLSADYINGVKTQEEALKYYSSDYEKYSQLWDEGYDIRSVALIELVDEYGLNIDEKQLEELRNNSQIVIENRELEKSIDEMVKNIKFENDKNEYGLKYYSTIVENTTDTKFDNFDLEISLLDENDIVVDTQYAMASNWKPEQKFKFEFLTEKEFKKIEWEYTYYIE